MQTSELPVSLGVEQRFPRKAVNVKTNLPPLMIAKDYLFGCRQFGKLTQSSFELITINYFTGKTWNWPENSKLLPITVGVSIN